MTARPPGPRPIRRRRALASTIIALALVAGCGAGDDDDMDIDAQRDLLEQGLRAAAEEFGGPDPRLETAPCDEPVRSGREQWQGDATTDVPAGDMTEKLEAVSRAWDELGIESDITTLDDGSEPRLSGEAGDVGLAVTVSYEFEGKVRIGISGSTACADL